MLNFLLEAAETGTEVVPTFGERMGELLDSLLAKGWDFVVHTGLRVILAILILFVSFRVQKAL